MSEYVCTHCSKSFKRMPSQVKKNRIKSKSDNIFCSSSCAASFNNKIPKRPRLKTDSEWYKKQARRNFIRDNARRLSKKLGWTCCKICGYTKHFETAHIRPVSDFPVDTHVSIINDPSNLMPLCPNCHWEHDNL